MANHPKHVRAWLWAALATLSLYACSVLIPRQGWDPSYGPVVPHDSFPTDCRLCHTGGDWHTLKSEFEFDHEKQTGTALLGAHAKVSCLLCHNDRGPVAQFAAKGCAGCHEDPHRAEFGRDCSACHQQRTWQPEGQIAAHNLTRMPLFGAHASVACFRCHPGAQVGNFAGQSPKCEHCHGADLARATAPDHIASGFTQDCQRCHRPIGWTPAEFQHSASFPLTAGHADRRCSECHTTPGTYSGLSTDCSSCHQDDYASTTVLPHAAAGIPMTCAQCHNTSSWHGANFPHTAAFPLSGGHRIGCNRCHTTPGVFTGLVTACVSCHQTQFNNTTVIPHQAAGFSTDCAQCHDTSSWTHANFPHSTTFPLSGGHNVSCNRCHTTPGVFTGLATTCVSCHQAQFNNTTVIPHQAAGFSTDCTQCHDTSSWNNANFPHSSTFPLSGGHNVTCNRCHTTPGVFTGLATTCASCHLPDYQASTNPAHASYRFPQTCNDCHTTTAWRPANWTHRFPRTGNHNVTCTECHNDPTNRSLFSCIHCHEHSQSSMDSKHRGRNGYSWNSIACLNCHPNGRH